MAETWEAIKQDLQYAFERHRNYASHFKREDVWRELEDRFREQLDDFQRIDPPKTPAELQYRSKLRDDIALDWERTFLVLDADKGTRGAGGVVRSVFRLNDSIQALDVGSTKLTKQMLRLTIWITVMTFVLLVMTGVMVWDIILTHWIMK